MTNEPETTDAPSNEGWDRDYSSRGERSRQQLRGYIRELQRLLMVYEFGMEEVMTKVNILRTEFQRMHRYNPIEHVGSRLKTLESLVKKAHKKEISLDPDVLREQVYDIAGVRLTCSFVSDIYRMRNLLLNQSDVELIRERDYIKKPKENGYQSLHLVVEVPVFLADSVEHVPVEIQLRTVAMDFWASLEHKIYYKYEKSVPSHLTDALKLAADVASTLDRSMERIHEEILYLDEARRVAGEYDEEDASDDILAALMQSFPNLLQGVQEDEAPADATAGEGTDGGGFD